MKIEPHIETALPQLELRVLYGPQAGSRLTLAPGDYLLGNGDECAVMLAGPKIRGTHARLRFDGDRPLIEPVEGSVLDPEGNPVEQVLPVALGMPIELEGVWIAIDEIDAPWPDLDLVIPRPGTRGSAEGDETRNATLEAPQEDTHMPGPTDLSSGEQRQRRRAQYMLVISTTILLVLAAGGITGAVKLLGQTAPMADAPGEPQTVTQLRARLHEIAPGRQLTVTARPDGNPDVRGYVRDQAMEAEIREAIRKFANTPAVHLLLDSELLTNARKAAAGLQDPSRAMFEVSEVLNGVASLKGSVASPAVREEVQDALRRAVPELRAIESAMRQAADLPDLLQERIAAAGLARRIQVVDEQPTFIVRGTLSEDELPRWEALLASFTTEFGTLLPIRASIVPLKRLLPVNIQTVIGGAMPFVITDHGQRIGPGGAAGNHTLSSIGDKEVIFDGRQRIRIPR